MTRKSKGFLYLTQYISGERLLKKLYKNLGVPSSSPIVDDNFQAGNLRRYETEWVLQLLICHT